VECQEVRKQDKIFPSGKMRIKGGKYEKNEF
jgi:hypothetical protein